MITPSPRESRTKSKHRAYVFTILCGSVLISPGCKVPGLRCAQPGPATPQAYNWNNGHAFWNPSSVSDQTDAPSTYGDTANTDGQDEFGSNGEGDEANSASSKPKQSFVSFIKAASFLRLEKPENNTQDAEVELADDLVLIDNASGAVSTAGNPASIEEPFANNLDFGLGDDGSVSINGPGSVNGTGKIDLGVSSFENSGQLPQSVFFDDPFLLGLINEALAGNQELKILAEEIQIARNETYARSGEYRPFVTLGGGAGLEKSGTYTRAGAVEEQLEVAPGRGFPDPLPDFLVATNVSWEIDIWNRLRNAQRAAAMRYLGSQEGRNFTVTRLVSEVAESYYELLALDNRLLTLDRTIEIQQQSLTIAKSKKDAGRGTELAVQRFQAEVQKNQSERALIEQEIVELENRVNFLAGRYPQPVDRISVAFVDLNLNTLSAGVPSQLLRNRADIREAERQVAAAGLDVKVARARFYPSLTLTGGLGWNAFATGYLFQTPESLLYSVAGDLVGPLINKRAIKADYSSANAAQLQTIYNYQQTVLEAHIEVVNQISKVDNLRRSIDIKKQQLASLEASVDSATKLFQNARAEYVEVLLAQREMMEARMGLIETKQEQLSAIVKAYQALGGGAF